MWLSLRTGNQQQSRKMMTEYKDGDIEKQAAYFARKEAQALERMLQLVGEDDWNFLYRGRQEPPSHV
jgi:hypothetical protein